MAASQEMEVCGPLLKGIVLRLTLWHLSRGGVYSTIFLGNVQVRECRSTSAHVVVLRLEQNTQWYIVRFSTRNTQFRRSLQVTTHAKPPRTRKEKQTKHAEMIDNNVNTQKMNECGDRLTAKKSKTRVNRRGIRRERRCHSTQ